MSSFRDFFAVPPGLTLEKIKKMPPEEREKFKLKSDVEIVLRDLCRKGLTIAKIAENFNVPARTLNDWKCIFPAVSAALKKTRARWLGEVADSAYKTAKGYFVTEEKSVVTKHPDGKITQTNEKNRRWISPHSGILKYILTTQDPEFWKEKLGFTEENSAALENFSNAVTGLLKKGGKETKRD
jgi:hypothetical protein